MTTLTRQQLTKLSEEATALADWTTVRDFASQVYGEGKAASVEIETHGEYNDEGSTDYSVESVTAYDDRGEELDYDLTLPFWAQPCFSDLHEEDADDAQEAARQALKEWYVWRDEDKALVAKHG